WTATVELVMVSGWIWIAAAGRAPPRGRVWLGGVGRGGSTVGIGRARPGVEVLAAARLDLAWWSRRGALLLPGRAIPVLYRWPTAGWRPIWPLGQMA
ncbi:hypothetical protein Dimus_005893, partial [Dionaea muscipula]